MNLNTTTTIGTGAAEEKLKLAAIFFDQIVPIQKEHGVPQDLICNISIQ